MQVLAVLQGLVHPRILREWCLTGEPFGADAALAAGLLNYVVPAEKPRRNHRLARRPRDRQIPDRHPPRQICVACAGLDVVRAGYSLRRGPASAACRNRGRKGRPRRLQREAQADLDRALRPMARKEKIRIGGASGFWGDSSLAAPQLVGKGDIDYLVFDYLAETTMAILAAMRNKDSRSGYATDFVEIAMRSTLRDIAAKGIKVVSNAGGINPKACAAALEALARELGVEPKIAVVEGDDVSALLPELRAAGQRDMFTGEPLPEKILSANAYLGALPIAQRAGRRRRHRHHRTLRRQRSDAWAADPRIRLAGRRLRSARRRQPRGSYHRVRLPGDRRPVHRLAARRRLGEHRLSGRRMFSRRAFRRHQAAGHRRADRPRGGRRATALRDRRSCRLYPAGRSVRFPRCAHRAGDR